MNIRNRIAAVPFVTATLVLSIIVALPAPAQIPDTFSNLQVLPKDISQPDLIT